MLLDRLRTSPAASLVDWATVERLTPYGGIRIEDDVVCGSGAEAPESLTRRGLCGVRLSGARQRKTWACVSRAQ